MRAIHAALLLVPAASTSALAEVTARSEQGFVVRHEATVPADALASWIKLIEPAKWWSSAHTFSGDATNLALDAVAGGCFCENLPDPSKSERASPRGSVEHLRVLYSERARMLRLTGALGPLQSEAVQGKLTITLTPGEAGTTIKFEYVVGGYMRFKTEQIAPAVDRVLGEQLASLAAKLGASPPAPPPAK